MENKNLSPPFNEFKFGLQKAYSFYDDLKSVSEHQIHESMNNIVQATFGKTEFLVVGYCDGYNEFFVKKVIQKVQCFVCLDKKVKLN